MTAATTSAALQFGSRVIGAGCGAVATAFLARGIGREEFGIFVAALAAAGVAALASDVGLTQATTRGIVLDGSNARHLIRSALLVRLMLSIPLTGLAYLALPSVEDPRTILLILATVPVSAFTVLQCSTVALRRTHTLPASWLAQGLTWLLAAVVLWRVQAPTHHYALAFLCALGAQQVVLGRLHARHLPLLGRQVHSSGITPILALLRASWPLGAANLLWAAMQRLPIVAAAPLAGAAQAAAVGAATRLNDAFYLFPTVIGNMALPGLVSREQKPSEAARRMTDALIGTMLVLTTAIFLGAAVTAEVLTVLLFGPEFRGAGPVLVVVSASLIPFALDAVWGTAAVGSGRQRTMASTAAISLLTSALLIPILIPRFGAVGAGLCILAGQTIRTALLASTIRSLVGLGGVGRWGGWLAATACVAATSASVSDALGESSAVVTMLLGLLAAISLVVLGALFGAVKKEDWRTLRALQAP